LTKAYLAETMYGLNRPAEALIVCREAISTLEQFEQKLVTDFDGDVRNPVHYPYGQKKYLRRALLAIEGKCLIQIGEDESGHERLHDAADIDLGREVDEHPFFVGIESLSKEFTTRTELETLLAADQRRLLDLLTAKKKADATIERLNDLISAVATTQAEWESALLRLKEKATEDEIAEKFLGEIHALCVLISRKDVSRYQVIKKAIENSFPRLPSRAIEQLANAEFLLVSHNQVQLPIYAGAIIVLSSVDESWKAYRDSSFGHHSDWMGSELPKILRRVKDEFRNGCAHSSSGSRRTAMALKELIRNSCVLSELEAITGASFSGRLLS
jgi:hypothetical protein